MKSNKLISSPPKLNVDKKYSHIGWLHQSHQYETEVDEEVY